MLVRRARERIAELGERAEVWTPGGVVEFFCECGVEGGCGERLRMSLRVYETV